MDGGEGTKLKSPVSGIEVTADEVDFDATAEPWTTLKLSDGSTLKLKPVITKVIRYGDYDQHGDPIYQVFASEVVRVMGVRKDLKGKPLMPNMKPAPATVEVG